MVIKNLRMARKYGKTDLTKGNVLRFVEVLLALAYGEIESPEDRLEGRTFKIEWAGKNANQSIGSGEAWIEISKRTGRKQKEKREVGITKKDLWILMNYYWKDDISLKLSKNKDRTPVNYKTWNEKKKTLFNIFFLAEQS